MLLQFNIHTKRLQFTAESWEQLIADNYQFHYAASGRTSFPSCRGCKRQIVKTEPRIEMKQHWTPPNCGPIPIKVYFCVNAACIATRSVRILRVSFTDLFQAIV
jgi:hypothetical protein